MIIFTLAFAFFGAGFETSSTTISFCLYELSKNPEIQKRVHDEIHRVLEEHNGEMTYESVSQMKLLEYCVEGMDVSFIIFLQIETRSVLFSETLRMYTVFVNILRKCVKNYQIPDTDIIIEKDDVIVIPAFAIHRDEKYYPEPNKFNPNRFNPQNSAGKNQLNRPLLSFGDGQRNCIGTHKYILLFLNFFIHMFILFAGMRLGRMQAQVALAIMLKKFRYELDERTKNREMAFEVKSTLVTPRDGIFLKVFKI